MAAATNPVAAPCSHGGLQSDRDLVCDELLEQFIAKRPDKIDGALSCFDRVLFRGYLPLFSGAAIAAFLDSRSIQRQELKSFLLRQACLVRDHTRRMTERVRKDELARQLAERDDIQQGLVCVFETL